jgi:hypothetical protein
MNKTFKFPPQACQFPPLHNVSTPGALMAGRMTKAAIGCQAAINTEIGVPAEINTEIGVPAAIDTEIGLNPAILAEVPPQRIGNTSKPASSTSRLKAPQSARSLLELIKTAKVLQGKAEQAEGKAEQAVKKADQFYVLLGLTLAELKARRPKDVTWLDFVKLHFGYSRERADELIRIGSGSTTIEAVRANTAARVQKHRAADTVLRNTGSPPVDQTQAALDAAADDEEYVIPGDEGYAEDLLEQKVHDADVKAMGLLSKCIIGIGHQPSFKKDQLRETMQALETVLEALQEVYVTLPEDDVVVGG